VVAYLLDDGDLQIVLARLRRTVRLRQSRQSRQSRQAAEVGSAHLPAESAESRRY
jgi:hypothetical protein